MWPFGKKNEKNEIRKDLLELGLDPKFNEENIPQIDEKALSMMVEDSLREIDPNSIELTEQDEMDPSLLAELSGLEEANNQNGKSLMEQLHELETAIRAEKKACLELKKQGDMEGVQMKLLHVSNLRDKADAIRIKINPDLANDIDNKQDTQLVTESPPQIRPKVQKELNTKEIEQNAPPPKVATPSVQKDMNSLLNEVNQRIAVTKSIAIIYRDQGKPEEGKSTVKVMQALQQIATRIKNGETITLDEIPPVPPKPFIDHQDMELDAPAPQTKSTNTAKVTKPQEVISPNQVKASALPSVPTKQDPKTLKSAPTPHPKAAEVKSVQSLDPRDEALLFIEKILKVQIVNANNTATKLRDAEEKKNAISWLNKKKGWQEDLDKIAAIKNHKEIPPPLYHYETTEVSLPRINNDLALYDFEVTILNCRHIKAPPDYNKLNIIIHCEFPFDNNNPQKWSTPGYNIQGPQFNPEINFRKILRIERKKSLERQIETKKIIFNIYHQRGFFFSDISLGRAEIKLSDLKSNCTVEADAEILEGRKPSGGKIYVQLRVRTPIVPNSDRQLSHERFLIIDKHYSIEDLLQSRLAATAKQNEAISQETKVKKAISTEKKKVQTDKAIKVTDEIEKPIETLVKKPVEVEKPIEKPAEPTENVDNFNLDPKDEMLLDEDIKVEVSQQPPEVKQHTSVPKTTVSQVTGKQRRQPATPPPLDTDSIDWIVSNAVLEREVESTKTRIAELKKQKKATDDESLRLTLLETRMNILVYQIQSGVLTVEVYTQLLQEKIQQEKEISVVLKAKGETDKANRCLERATLMEKELAGEV